MHILNCFKRRHASSIGQHFSPKKTSFMYYAMLKADYKKPARILLIKSCQCVPQLHKEFIPRKKGS